MDAEDAPLASASQAAAVLMLDRLRELHPAAGPAIDASVAASMPDVQAISEREKNETVRRLFADAKAGREAGGVGAERRFERAMAVIDSVDQGWADAVQASFHRLLQEWVDRGEPLLGPGGWIRVAARPYHRGSVWWSDPAQTDQWCRTVAHDVFTGIVADPRSRAGDTVRLAQVSEPSIGPALDVSIMTMLGDFHDQQRYDAARYGVHPLQAQEAAERIHAMRAPLTQVCRSELERLLREWQTQGPPPVDTGAGEDSGNQREFPTGG